MKVQIRNISLLVCVLWTVVGRCDCFLFDWSNKTTSAIVTLPTTPKSTTLNFTATGVPSPKFRIDPVKAEAGTIAGVVFAVLLCTAVLVVVGIMYLRRKRQRDEEYRRHAMVQKTSAESAGVYMETTTDNMYRPESRGAAPNRKYTSLKKKDPNMYEDDSEDEL